MSAPRASILAILAVAAVAAIALGRAETRAVTPTPTPTPAPEVFQGPSGGVLLALQILRGEPLVASTAPSASGGTSAGAGGTDVLVDGGSYFQNETSLAVNGGTLCGGYNDAQAQGTSEVARSYDGGASWAQLNGIDFGHSGDPAIAVHKATNTFYYGDIYFGSGIPAIGVTKSTDGCQTFGTTAIASPNEVSPQDLQDKPWIAVDNSGGPYDGNVYACWTRFLGFFPYGVSFFSDLRVSRSIDGGATFIDDQAVSPLGFVFPIGCHMGVGPNGEAYVAWSDRSATFPIRFRRSLDGGQTWESAVQVNGPPIRQPGSDRLVNCGGEPFNRPTLNGDIRQVGQAWLAVDTTGGPRNGNIYVVWAHDPPSLVDNSDVYFSYSDDGGLSWTTQMQLAGGTETDQFEPFVEVGSNGTVAVAWYDRRNDPLNNYLIDVYTAFSRDGGVTFDPIERVSDVSFPPITYSCYMGEYLAVAGDANFFYYLWGDNRNADPDVYFDRLPAPPLAPPTPTRTATTPPTLTPTPRPVGGVSHDTLLPQQRSASERGSTDHAGWIAAAVAGMTLCGAAWFALRRRVK